MSCERNFDLYGRRKGWRELWLRRVSFRMVLLLLATLCLASLAEVVSAQVRVTAIWKDGQSLKNTNDVRCRHDNLSEEGIYLEMVLKPWDQISSPSGLVYIELTAPNGSVFKGSDKLAIILLPPEKKDLVINVFSGRGDMQASGGGAMSSGEVGIVIVKTEYAVEVRHTEEGPVREFTVLEGEVTLRAPSPPGIFEGAVPRDAVQLPGMSLSTGQKVVFDSQSRLKVKKKEIDVEDIAKSALVYARLDTAKAMMRKTVDPKETYANLLDRYQAVFRHPTDPGPRLRLAIDQVNLNVNLAAFYQLKKADDFTPPDQNTTHAAIAIARGAAFAQTGNKEAARKEIQRARILDASTLNEDNLRRFRFDEKIHTEILIYNSGSVSPVDESFQNLGRWPTPANLTAPQQKIFELIREQRFAEAQKVWQENSRSLNGQLNSVDAYAIAIISFELKDVKNASFQASQALRLGRTDNRLSKDVYAAAEKIYQANQQ